MSFSCRKSAPIMYLVASVNFPATNRVYVRQLSEKRKTTEKLSKKATGKLFTHSFYTYGQFLNVNIIV